MNKRDVFLVIVIAAVVGVVSSLVTSNVMMGPPTTGISNKIVATSCDGDNDCEGNLFKTKSFESDGDQAQFSGFEAKHSYSAMPISYSLSKIDGQSIAIRRYGGTDLEKVLRYESILTPGGLKTIYKDNIIGNKHETNIEPMKIQIISDEWFGPNYETNIEPMKIQISDHRSGELDSKIILTPFGLKTNYYGGIYGPPQEMNILPWRMEATYLARESEEDDSISFACLDADGRLFRSDTLCQ